MAKKVFTMAPNVYFCKQLNKGGKNEIAWTLVGKILLDICRLCIILLVSDSVQETSSTRQWKC